MPTPHDFFHSLFTSLFSWVYFILALPAGFFLDYLGFLSFGAFILSHPMFHPPPRSTLPFPCALHVGDVCSGTVQRASCSPVPMRQLCGRLGYGKSPPRPFSHAPPFDFLATFTYILSSFTPLKLWVLISCCHAPKLPTHLFCSSGSPSPPDALTCSRGRLSLFT